jgi:hypothetical protein
LPSNAGVSHLDGIIDGLQREKGRLRMLNRPRNAGLNPKLQKSGLWILVFSPLSASTASASATNPPVTAVVRTSGTEFTMDGEMFFVIRINNHYLTFGSHDEVTRVFDDAEAGAASPGSGSRHAS